MPSQGIYYALAETAENHWRELAEKALSCWWLYNSGDHSPWPHPGRLSRAFLNQIAFLGGDPGNQAARAHASTLLAVNLAAASMQWTPQG